MVMDRLAILAEAKEGRYHNRFVLIYLLVKINNLTRYKGKEWNCFINQIVAFYHQLKASTDSYQVKTTDSDAGLMAQLLILTNTSQFLSKDMIDELLDSSGMLATTMAESYLRVRHLQQKS